MHPSIRRLFFVILILAGLAVFAAVVALWPGNAGGGGMEGGSAGAALSPSGEGPLSPGGGAVPAPEEKPVSATAGENAITRRAVTPAGLFISGRVIDEVTGEAVPAFYFRLGREQEEASKGRRSRWENVISEDVEDPEGRFCFALKQGGRFQARVGNSSHLERVIDGIEIREEQGLTGLEIELDPGLSVSGRVVEDATGRPVADAVVGATQYSSDVLESLLTGRKERGIHTATDEEGRFVLMGLPPERQKIAAVHPDFAEGCVSAVPGRRGAIEIRLKPGFYVFGTVRDDSGKPCSGAFVTLAGDDIPLWRFAVAREDGSYRTPPAAPGEVEVAAGPPPGGDERRFNLTKEWKYTEIEDRDVEVNFGPLPDHVTWRGAFFGYDGKPQAWGSIVLRKVIVDYASFKSRIGDSRWGECDAGGRFEVRRILPGRYKVSLYMADGTWAHDALTVLLDEPGVIEKDIDLSKSAEGAAIKGIVINGDTGAPLDVKRARVNGFVTTPSYKSYTANIGPGGRFSLKRLLPGRYFLSVQAKGFPAKRISGIEVEKNQVIEGLRIVLEPGGELCLRLTGFKESDPRVFSLSVTHEEDRPISYSKQTIGAGGVFEYTYTFEPGRWSLSVSIEGIGFIEKRCDVVKGGLTLVEIRRDEFLPLAATVGVAGTVVRPRGEPVPGCRLFFYGYDVPGLDRKARYIQGTTDDQGRFALGGFRPGRWYAHALLDKGGYANFPDLVIPADSPDPFVVHLVLPGGKVTGFLYDKLTGLRFTKEGPVWWVFLKDKATNRTVCEIQGGQKGERFIFDGVPAGRFTVTVHARGYRDADAAVFQYDGTGVRDIGRIGLDPCGVLELAVEGPAGEPIETFDLFCNGNPLWRFDREVLGDGRFRLSNLPLGEVVIEAAAEGFETGKKTLTLEPGRPASARFVLKRK